MKVRKYGKVRGAPCIGQMQSAQQLLQPDFRDFVLSSVISNTLLWLEVVLADLFRSFFPSSFFPFFCLAFHLLSCGCTFFIFLCCFFCIPYVYLLRIFYLLHFFIISLFLFFLSCLISFLLYSFLAFFLSCFLVNSFLALFLSCFISFLLHFFLAIFLSCFISLLLYFFLALFLSVFLYCFLSFCISLCHLLCLFKHVLSLETERNGSMIYVKLLLRCVIYSPCKKVIYGAIYDKHIWLHIWIFGIYGLPIHGQPIYAENPCGAIYACHIWLLIWYCKRSNSEYRTTHLRIVIFDAVRRVPHNLQILGVPTATRPVKKNGV